MQRIRASLVLTAGLGLAACTEKPAAETAPPSTPKAPVAKTAAGPGSQPSSGPASQPATEARAAATKARLEKTEAGRLLAASIDAHGGLKAWFNGALQFRYDYKPSEGAQRRSMQVVDLMTARVYHDMEKPVKGQLAWDGQKAWKKLGEGGDKFAARFWALTPYYFVGMPFVLGDPGVRLEIVNDDPKAAGFEAADVVKATFEPGTGDAPDDYYVLYLDKTSHRLLGLRYVVSYAPFFKGQDVKHTPERLLVYSDWSAAGDVELARSHTFYDFTDGKKGPSRSQGGVTDVAHGVTFDASRLKMPEGAVESKI